MISDISRVGVVLRVRTSLSVGGREAVESRNADLKGAPCRGVNGDLDRESNLPGERDRDMLKETRRSDERPGVDGRPLLTVLPEA